MNTHLQIGNLYRLKETVGNEHQDHWFTYPAGLLLKLDGIEVYPEDEECGQHFAEVLYIFETLDGMTMVFDPDNVELIDPEQFEDNGIRVTIEEIKENITRLDPVVPPSLKTYNFDGEIPF